MKYAVIFGSESGLAKAAINELVKLNFTIFCFDIKYQENSVNGNLHFIHADVTSDDDLSFAYSYVSSITDKIDIISNFSGIVILGSLVELPIDSLGKIININLLGTYKVNATFFPLIKNGNGRIINISSEYSKITAIPFHGYYGIAKHALDVYNDSLRRELLGSPVSVTAIRPGAFKTNMQGGITAQFETLVEQTEMYKKPLTKMQSIMVGELEKAKDPALFAKTYIKAVTKKHVAKYYKVNNSFKMKLLSALPSGVVDFIFGVYFK